MIKKYCIFINIVEPFNSLVNIEFPFPIGFHCMIDLKISLKLLIFAIVRVCGLIHYLLMILMDIHTTYVYI